MTPSEFIRTVYLGDRACKGLAVDSWNATVRIQVNTISRVRSTSGSWDYYTDEDINDGWLVFRGVGEFRLENDGHIPNDSINDLKVVAENGNESTIEMSVDSVDEDGRRYETLLRLTCEAVHLEDPARPGIQIEM